MRIFVTGGTGFIGSKVCRMLAEGGHQVVTISRHPERAIQLREQGVQVMEGDITERESLREPMRGADGLFHIAGWYKVGAREKDMAHLINVVGTRNVLEMMRELAIPKGIYTSTLAVFGDTHSRVMDETDRPQGPWHTIYDRTKYEAHYEVAEPLIQEGLPLTIVMPGLVYGIGDHSLFRDTLRAYLQGKLPVIPRGVAYCWAHVEDIARAHLLAMEGGKPGDTYIIAGPVHTLREVLEVVERFSGVPMPSLHLGSWFWKLSDYAVRPLDFLGLPLPKLYRPEVLRLQAGVTYLGSNMKAREELGYQPRAITEGLPEVVRYEMRELGLEV